MKQQGKLMAFCLIAMLSCSKAELAPLPSADESEGYTGITMTVTPRMTDSKTAFSDNGDGTYQALWTPGDAISMSYCESGAAKFSDFNKKLSSSASARVHTTQFSGIIYAPAKAGDYDFYAVYPHSCVMDSSVPGAVKVSLPQAQIFGAGTFDPKADILFGKKETISVTNSVKDLKNTDIHFARLVSLARIKVDASACTNSLVNLGEAVVGVSFKNGSDVVFSGTLTVNPDKLSELEIGKDGKSSIEGVPSAETTLGTLDAMLALAPCELSAGAALTISIRTTTKLYTKTISLPAATAFNPGEVKLLPCRIDENWTVSDAPVFSGGEGTQANPYLISYPADLLQFSALTNGSETAAYNDKYYIQTADIDMSSAGNYVPAASTVAFSGSYDGQGFSISKISVSGKSGSPSGLFSLLNGAKVSNLTVKDMTVNATASYVGSITGKAENATVISGCCYEGELVSNQQYLGGIAGYCAKSTINNCTVNGTVKNLFLSTRYNSSAPNDNGIVGGIVGHYCQGSSSTGCTMNGKVFAVASYSGGFAGYWTTSTIDGFHLTKGSEVSSDENYIGGIVAYQGGTSNDAFTTNRIDNCVVEGCVGGRGNYVGGIAGRSIAGEIKACIVSSSCKINTYKSYAGGIVGIVNATASPVRITNCAVYGDVTAVCRVGGIAGYVSQTAAKPVDITNCAFVGGKLYATKIVAGKTGNEAQVGGIIGFMYGCSANGGYVRIANCYARPEYIAVSKFSNSPAMAGITGYFQARCSIYNCYCDIDYGSMLYDWKSIKELGLTDNGIGSQVYGGIYGDYLAACTNPAYNCALDHLYYMSGVKMGENTAAMQTAGLLTNCGTFTVATAGQELVDKMNEGVEAYNKMTHAVDAVKWVVGSDGFATLSNILGNPSVPKKNPLRVSVIGDSISTFRGYIPNGYGAHYPTTDGALDFVQQTYWWKLINEYMSNAVLEKNISNSGTTVARRGDDFELSASGGHCFIYRYTREGIGRPDVVLVAGGSNDYTHIKDMGNGVSCKNATEAPDDSYLNSLYAQSTIAVSDSTKFCPAYVHLLRCITTDHPNAKIVCIIGDRESTGQQKAIKKMAEHYGAKVVDLLSVNGFNENTYMPKHDYATGGVHPGAEGHAFIANKIYAECGLWLEGF